MPRLPAIDTETNANHSPHVVILGAGASVAACPTGDRHGRPLPVMRTLIDTLDLRSDLERAGLDLSSGNFEQIYSGLAGDASTADLVRDMESRVREYFVRLELPDHATVYDALLLSLREKDVVATFNWDPLLLQAYQRVADLGRTPKILFLHGNVGVGYCATDRVAGLIGGTCGTCGRPLTPSPLLFPVTQKDYRADPFLGSQWDALDEYLEHAFMLTIFGYSAPASDAAARELLQRAWSRNATRDLAQIELVDVRGRSDVVANWQDFIVREHFGVTDRFEHTWAFRQPRASCDALAGAILMNNPWQDAPLLTRGLDAETKLGTLRSAVASLIAEERELETSGRPFDRGARRGEGLAISR
ncbi:MAG: hypothetical protein KGL93_11190 [Gemmatimonadota bacterium]|nr:hypothetical protein [Gemmatimonadota bacterium]